MRIVVLDGYTLNPGDLTWEPLQAYGEVTVYERTPVELIVERAKDAEIVLTNKTPLRADTLDMLPKLTYIGVLATGYDVVDVGAAADREIPVTNIPAYGTDSVAQFTIALLLELCHRIGAHSDSVRRGEWAANADWCYWRSPLVELSGKTFGLIGAGRIGLQTAAIAAALGMKVLAAVGSSGPKETGIAGLRWGDLDTVLREADVLSLHCPLTPSTQGMINRDNLGKMKRTAFLLNTSRGKLVHEQDLADALNEGRIAGAGLDVLSVEPPAADNPLLSAANCIVTPHIAWAAKEARERLLSMAAANIGAYLSGSSVNVVNRRDG